MQNKPNLREAKMNVTSVTIANYEETRPPNPAKANPKQTQFNPIQSQLKPISKKAKNERK